MEMEDVELQNEDKQDENKRAAGVPYPVEPVLESLATIGKIVASFGSSAVISKEDISKETGKKQATLNLHYSTYQQYGILEKVHGKGFRTTSLYKKYADKVYASHEREALLQMFKNAPLYSKIIDKLNNEYLPAEEKFAILLKGEPYNVTESAAERASKIFFDNVRALNLVVNNKFQYSPLSNGAETPPNGQAKDGHTPPPNRDPAPNTITITIPFKKKGSKAVLSLPDDYEDADIDKIARIVQAYKQDEKE
jgi:hypothetical protein